ncbi:hypothetical protein [Mesotoga prima]|uniref:leucine-rich repeat domain-containing protein n=1 Tax=Mesotoga prima TaxID=1184387 RepID=UPI002FE03D87
MVSDGRSALINSLENTSAVEVLLDKSVSEEDLSFPDNVLRIIATKEDGTFLSLTKIGSDFSVGEFLFSVKSALRPDKIVVVSHSTLVEKTLPMISVSVSTPRGISIKETSVDCSSKGVVAVRGRDLVGFCGVEMSVVYDSDAFTIDLERGTDGITLMNGFEGHLTIVKHNEGELTIAVAFPSEKNITDEIIFLINILSGNIEQRTFIEMNGELMDGEANQISTKFTGGFLEIGGPRLIGDFDSNEIVDVTDFIYFARYYGRSEGDERFDSTYDIAPAVDSFGGIWLGIYDKSYPDGKIDITDFIVFARNYGKKWPYDPPPSPLNVFPNHESSNLEIDVMLEWKCKNYEEEEIVYDIYFGSELPLELLAGDYTDSVFLLENLENSTTYYWKIVVKDSGGNVTEGDLWSFSTKEMKLFFCEDFEEPNFLNKGWKVSGASWPFIQSQEVFEGNYSLSFLQIPAVNSELGEFSGSIEIILSIPEDSYILFQRKVSGYAGCLSFFIDGIGLGKWFSISDLWSDYTSKPEGLNPVVSDLGWSEVVRIVPAGTHIFKWEYEDHRLTQTNESNSAWIDEVRIVSSVSLGKEVIFPDPMVDNIIRSHIGKAASEKIREREVQDISTLMISNYLLNIATFDRNSQLSELARDYTDSFHINSLEHVDLAGIENCKDLITLYVAGTLSDLNPLKECENLRSIWFLCSEVEDFSPLADLEKLWGISFEGGSLDLSTISEIGSLELLVLYDVTLLPSVDDLEKIDNIRFLGLRSCDLGSVGFLNKMPQLELLDISRNHISDISQIASLKKLECAYLFENLISNLPSFQEVSPLSCLNLSHNNITDISILAQTLNMHNGGCLDLSNNKLCISSGSETQSHIVALRDKGINVRYIPQKQPGVPYNPSPSNYQSGVEIDAVLSWECYDDFVEGECLLYDLSISTSPFDSSIPPTSTVENLSNKHYYPDRLLPSTKYYWRVGSKFEGGSVTWGPQWLFTTAGE